MNRLLAKNPDARFQTAGEVAELLSRYLVHLQHDPLVPFQAEEQPQPRTIREDRDEEGGQRKHRPAPSNLRWPMVVGVAVMLMGIAVLAALESTPLTNCTGLAPPYLFSALLTPELLAPTMSRREWPSADGDRHAAALLRGSSGGALYREMVKEVRETLANLGAHFPNYRGQGFEIAGFVYFSGWNDMLEANPFYAELLANLIRDVRVDLKAPNLPFVIGQLGVDPDRVQPGSNDGNFRIAQAAAASLPEFKGNVKLVETDPFWDGEAHAVLKKGVEKHKDEWDKVGSDAGYHYLGSAKTFCAIGEAFGEAMIELRRSGARN